MSNTLLEQWRNIAYDESADRGQLQRFWGTYFQIEKEIYEQLLTNPDEEVKGTVKELAEKYIAAKKEEYRQYRAQITEWEIQKYLRVI